MCVCEKPLHIARALSYLLVQTWRRGPCPGNHPTPVLQGRNHRHADRIASS